MNRPFHNMKHSSIDGFHNMKSSVVASVGHIHCMKHDAPYPNKIAELRKSSGLVQRDIAKAWNCDTPLVSRIEKGDVGITQEKMLALFKSFGWTPSQVYGTDDKELPVVQVVGYVGAGVVYPYDDYAKGDGIEEVPCPRGFENTEIIAVRVKGDSMRPMLRDGWLLFYSRDHTGVPVECINEVCVVRLANDGMMVREVKKGSKAGLYHLISYNGETQFDAKLEWAAKIIDYRPR